MNKSPKKIWMSEYTLWECYKIQHEDDIPYIRADLVDELVEALEGMLDWFGYPEDHECSRSDKARAALAKLEESHE